MKRLKVLGVESNNYDLSSTKYYLEDLGVDVETASNGITAIGLVSQKKYDLIFIDLFMVKTEAFDLLAYLKKNKIGSLVPIIVLSCNSKDRDIDLALELGASDFVTQPIDPESLCHKLVSHLNYRPDNWQDVATLENEKEAYFNLTDRLEILGINKTGFTIRSKIKFCLNKDYKIESQFLNALKLSGKLVQLSSTIQIDKHFYSKVKFKNLSRNEKRRLEKFVFQNQTW